MKKLNKWYLPFFFIFSIWFLFAYPYFIKGEVPYPSTYQVNHFAPWSHFPEFWGPVKNGAMPDVISQIYPWKHFTIESFQKGQIPFWNPNNFAGNPHVANFQSAVFSPFNIFYFILPFIDAWSIIVLIQPLLAGIFTYLFLRQLSVSKIGSLISSVTFMFCGFIVVWMAYGTLAMSILFLPLALFAIENYFLSKKVKFLLLLALTIPLSFFSGHFQISLYFLIATSLYVIFNGIIKNDLRSLFIAIAVILCGIIFSLPQLIPSIEFYQNAVRSNLFLLSEAVPFQYIITVIAPDFFGNPVTRNDWFGHYAEWAGFIGIIPLVLASFSIYSKKVKTTLFFFLLGLLALILVIKSPFSDIFVSFKIPVLSTSSLSRIIVIFSFSFSVLAGFGLDSLKEIINHKKIKIIIIPFIAYFLIMLFVWFLLFILEVLPPDKDLIAKRNFFLSNILFIGMFMAIAFSFLKTKLLPYILFFLLIMVSFDSFRFATKWMPFDERRFVFPSVPITQAIKQNIGYGRIFGNLGTEVNAYYNFPSLEGYDPLYIGRYGEFIQSALNGEYVPAQRSIVKIDRSGKYTDRVFDLLGVSLVFHPIADTNQGWAYPVWKDMKRYTLVYKDDKFQLFKNNMVMQRVTLFYDYEIIKDSKSIINRFYSNDFDYKNKLILEKDPDLKTEVKGKGKADIVLYSPNKVIIKATTTNPAILFLSDNYYPGWKVKVNNLDVEILRANYTFRGVVVPKGNSLVEFNYSLF